MTIDNSDDLMLRAAIMYYQEDMTQAEIARELYLSRSKVSRLLKEARETRQVDIRINRGEQRNTFLEDIFIKLYGLKDALILSDISDDEDKAFDIVVKAAAGYIDSVMRRDSIVGIGRGKTLLSIVDKLEPKERLPIQVVQLVGLMNNPQQNEDEMDLVRKFARVYGGRSHNLFSPFVLDDKEARQVLNSVAAVGRTIDLANQANIILLSVGKFDLNDKDILWNSYLQPEEKARLSEIEPAGLFFGRYYDIDGQIIDTDLHNKIFGLEVKEIISREQVVCVAEGQEKVLPLLGALHGRLFKTLITDERTALNVLIREGKPI